MAAATLLKITPKKYLTFGGPFDKAVTSIITLTNISEGKIYFKVKDTARRRYCLRPKCGVIDPEETVEVSVTLQPFKYDSKKIPNHKIIILFMALTPAKEVLPLAKLWKNREPGDMVDKKLTCKFEMPAPEIPVNNDSATTDNAPLLQVPCNFGRQHYIGTKNHSNLVLKLKEGQELRANSLILSFNSPVIEHFVTNLHQGSIDMNDFSEPAVECFIDAMYTGGIALIDRPIFRDLHRMAYVFDVNWLVAKCEEYFRELIEALNGENFEDMCYVFEESRFVFDTTKKKKLLKSVMQKIIEEDGVEVFVTNYMKDFNNLSTKQIDLMLELVGNDIQILVLCLTNFLSNYGAIINDNVRHLLDKCNLSILSQYDKLLYENLFDILHGIEDISTADLKWVFSIYDLSEITSRTGPSENNTNNNSNNNSMNNNNINNNSINNNINNNSNEKSFIEKPFIEKSEFSEKSFTESDKSFSDFEKSLSDHKNYNSLDLP